MPFRVAIADGGLEIDAKIKREADLDNLIQILQTIKPLLQSIYGREPSALADPPDPPDFAEDGHRVFDASMMPHEAETGMSFFITKAQKAELRRLGYTEEQIREMKPEDAHKVLGLISFAYAVGTLHMSRNLILSAVLVASCVSFVSIPLFGHMSDRIGRRKIYLIGAVATGLFGFLYFGMVDTAIPSAVFIAIVLSLIPHDMQYGPQAALIAESFTPRLRYSGSSLGYQLASVIAGGPAPLIATALLMLRSWSFAAETAASTYPRAS